MEVVLVQEYSFNNEKFDCSEKGDAKSTLGLPDRVTEVNVYRKI